MTYTLHPEAAEELSTAAQFYLEQAGQTLAQAFVSEFERVAEQLVRNPALGTPSGTGLRIHPLRRFPYSVVYSPWPEGIQILVIAHQHRRPAYWRGRD